MLRRRGTTGRAGSCSHPFTGPTGSGEGPGQQRHRPRRCADLFRYAARGAADRGALATALLRFGVVHEQDP
ncbi:hypothetical protein, partial [Streptomyces sp. NPDC058629]|uniref:hypothetical protein n=1 Tax=Streptomyces sp. NPDC058629 TaxID=3346565 RepID=UPI00365EE6B4